MKLSFVLMTAVMASAVIADVPGFPVVDPALERGRCFVNQCELDGGGRIMMGDELEDYGNELAMSGIVTFNDCSCARGRCFEKVFDEPTTLHAVKYTWVACKLVCCSTNSVLTCLDITDDVGCNGVLACGASFCGDPHIKQLVGGWYDYHGECDLVFAHALEFADGAGLDIHARTKIRYDYSYIESAAVRIGVSDVLEVSSYGEYFLGGISNVDLQTASLAGFPISHEILDEKRHSFRVDLGNGAAILLDTMKDIVSIKIEPGDEGWARGSRLGSWLKDSSGLVGSLTNGNKLARNGTIILDPNEMGQEWQVRDNEPKSFVNPDRSPQYPAKCLLPDPAQAKKRRLGESPISEEAAELACRGWNKEEKGECIYDVMATGDLALAEAGTY